MHPGAVIEREHMMSSLAVICCWSEGDGVDGTRG